MKNPRTMSFEQLVSLRDTVDGLISSMAAKVKQGLQERMTWIDSLTGKAGSARTKKAHALRGRKVPPKYRNPKNRSETWAGRGAMPRWLTALVEQGHKVEEFAISHKAPAAKKTAARRKRAGRKRAATKGA
jgi:DNA-binding protein H-NS